MLRIFTISIILFLIPFNYLKGQYNSADRIVFDSVVVCKVYDSRREIVEFNEQSRDTSYIVKQAKLSLEDATNLTKRIFRKKSYGNSNYAQMVIPEIEIIYYYEGKSVHRIQTELTANYFFPSFEVKQQQRGEYLTGSYYKNSGITKYFKSFLFNLFVKYGIMEKNDDVFFFDKKQQY